MADDIDDLLDEVETKYLEKEKAKNDTQSRPKHNAKKDIAKYMHFYKGNTSMIRVQHPKKMNDAFSEERQNLDEDISDILSDIPLDKDLKKEKISNSSAKEDQTVPKYHPESARKCYPVFLGGSSHPVGQGSTISQRTCDQLRCTACDFKICIFDNFKWASDTNYLFLRNNVPDFDKLKTKLSFARGFRAYCCQCSWRTIKDLVQLNEPELKWVCGKH